MLLIDDHASHITTQMIDYCVSQKIILLCYERIKTEQDWSFNQFAVNASKCSA